MLAAGGTTVLSCQRERNRVDLRPAEVPPPQPLFPLYYIINLNIGRTILSFPKLVGTYPSVPMLNYALGYINMSQEEKLAADGGTLGAGVALLIFNLYL